MSAPQDRLDLADPAAVAAWFADLRLALADADAVTRDTLRRPRRRELGPVLARTNYRDALQRITSLLTFADPGPPEGPPEGSPADAPSPADPASRRRADPARRCGALPS
jgi:hypothetical protein